MKLSVSVVFCIFFTFAPGWSAVPASAQTLQQLQQQNEQILAELKAMRLLLEKLVTPGNSALPLAPEARIKLSALPSAYVLGRPDAPATIIEFTDLQCPFCRQFRVSTFPLLKKDYIDTGKVRFISFDFPLDNIHPLAGAAARANRCAGEQGKWWEMRDAIVINNASLTADIFTKLAADLGLNTDALLKCVADKATGEAVKADLDYGTAAGVVGTPTFIIGPTESSGIDGFRIVGAQSYAAFDAKLKQVLETK